MLWYFKKVLWLIVVFWSARNSSKTWEMVFVMVVSVVRDLGIHLPNRPQLAIGVRFIGILGQQTPRNGQRLRRGGQQAALRQVHKRHQSDFFVLRVFNCLESSDTSFSAVILTSSLPCTLSTGSKRTN